MKNYSKYHENRKKNREGYQDFYDRNVLLAHRCENCGRSLRKHTCELAHILPKSVFKSVATDDNNLLFLCCGFNIGGRGCHEEFDSTWENAKKMKVWDVAVERFKLLEPNIKENNFKILSHFYEYIEGNT